MTETSSINYEVQYVISLVKKIDQGHRRPIETLDNEVEILKIFMIYATRLDQWLEEMDLELITVLKLIGERIKNLDINDGTGGGGLWI